MVECEVPISNVDGMLESGNYHFAIVTRLNQQEPSTNAKFRKKLRRRRIHASS